MGKDRFKKQLLEMAARIAFARSHKEIDAFSLWRAYLKLAHEGNKELIKTLKMKFEDKFWDLYDPEEIQRKPDAELPWSPEVKKMIGPLSPLFKEYSGELTPENFLLILEAKGFLSDWSEFFRSKPSDHWATQKKGAKNNMVVVKKKHPKKSIKEYSKIIDGLEKMMKARVFGQASAIAAFVEGVRTAMDRPFKQGKLGGCFLFLGPNGSGKSESVKVLAEWLKDHSKALPIKNILYFEGYLYRILQTLRNKLDGKNLSIIVLNEFEKYEPIVREVLLEGLDSAVLNLPSKNDSNALEPVDISGSIVILIGNVGKSLWARLPFKEMEMLPDQDKIKEAILAEDIESEHSRVEAYKRRISSSFLDRIDYFIPFCQLRYADATKILEREISVLKHEMTERNVNIEIERNVIDLIVLSSFYKRSWSARQILRGYKEHIEQPVRKSHILYNNEDIQLICIDKKFNATLDRNVTHLLVIDDEWELVCKVLKKALPKTITVTGVPDVYHALEQVDKKPVDLLLLDMYFLGESKWKEYLAEWRYIAPDVPVVLFSGKIVSSTDRLEIDRIGGVIGFLEKEGDADRVKKSLKPYLEHASWQARLRAFENEYGHGGDRILFDKRISPNPKEPFIYFNNIQNIVNESIEVTDDDPVLPDTTRQEVEEFLEIFLDARKRAKLKVDRPKGILLYGSPGNGKTMLARSLARQMRCNFLPLSSSDFQSKWAGVATERLKKIFEQARMRQPSVVFIDELDAIAPHRGEDMGGGVVRDQASTVAALLTELDGFSGGNDIFFIGATNRKDSIDAALLRPGRIDRLIQVSSPGIKERRTLIEKSLKEIECKNFDLQWAASETYGLSCAEIKKVINDSVFISYRKKTKKSKDLSGDNVIIEKEHFQEAVDLIRFGQKPEELDADTELTISRREIIAWHEAGHLVLSMALLGILPERVSIVPRGNTGGHVRHSEKDVMRRSANRRRSSCLAEIAMILGGGLAEQIQFEEHTSGVAEDRKSAMRLAYFMVTKWGMGPIEAEIEGFLSEDTNKPVYSSVDKLAGRNFNIKGSVVSAMAEIINEATKIAFESLAENEAALKKSAELLLAKEELDQSIIKKDILTLVQQKL